MVEEHFVALALATNLEFGAIFHCSAFDDACADPVVDVELLFAQQVHAPAMQVNMPVEIILHCLQRFC
jgi:hypothetical protein